MAISASGCHSGGGRNPAGEGFGLGVLGGAMIVWMGVGLLRSRKAASSGGRDTPHSAFVSSIMLSGLNLFSLVWWLTIGSLLLMNFHETVGTPGLPLFTIVHWLCEFAWLSLVSFSVYRSCRFWSLKVQEWVLSNSGPQARVFRGSVHRNGSGALFNMTSIPVLY